ncbi:GNAT family N-acetyltransferase [Virgibacillus byunsanensis]|uniref:GNAT family N-acetyltransferase n=1 Tax=Virgibacillus byunsanensis TaxID=570945 RepID=A0ABW3LMW5_9BACI
MIKLEYFDQSDFKQLMNWIDSEEFLMQWAGPGFNYPLDELQLLNYIKDANHANATTFAYNVILQDSRETIGHISLGKIDRENGSARIGRVLIGGEGLRGQGIGQRMIEDVLKMAFDTLKLHRVSLGVFDFNKSAISCYQKAGFTKEGLIRDYRKVGSAYWSLWEMSILEDEWLNKNN